MEEMRMRCLERTGLAAMVIAFALAPTNLAYASKDPPTIPPAPKLGQTAYIPPLTPPALPGGKGTAGKLIDFQKWLPTNEWAAELERLFMKQSRHKWPHNVVEPTPD